MLYGLCVFAPFAFAMWRNAGLSEAYCVARRLRYSAGKRLPLRRENDLDTGAFPPFSFVCLTLLDLNSDSDGWRLSASPAGVDPDIEGLAGWVDH